MDSIPNWKKVLLDWINSSGLLNKNYVNLEQSDINEFFSKFISKVNNNSQQYTDVVSFLKAQYENFEIHLDDENQLSSADYIYCYSLLLHYCCVKNPNEHFHKICQNLPEQHQEAFSKLFSGLLETDLINKSNLRHVIGDASPRQLLQIPESPIIKKMPSNLRITQTTPKTSMLEEKTRELLYLRAQLDTEKYDKSLLEMQLKQNEEQIKKLSQQQRKYLSEIQELKNDLLYKNGSENYSPNKSHNEKQIKRRLLKQMADKEEECLTIKESNEMLNEKQKMLQEKLKLSGKEVSRLNQKVMSMEDKVHNINQELDQKNYEIKILLDEKNELKQFIDESRSISNGRDLNSSVECLDTSMSRNTSSSDSIQSPENLGTSVVDIQLREKIVENAQLVDENEGLKYENKSLSKLMCDLLRSNSDVFEICNENLLANDVDGNNLTQIFLVFENYIKKLIQNYTDKKLALKCLNDEQNALNLKNSNLIKEVSELDSTLSKLRTELFELDQEKYLLESDNDSLKINQNDLNTKIVILTKERETYLSTIKVLKTKLIKVETERNNDSSKFSQQVNDMSKDIQKKSNEIEELAKNNQDLSCRIIELQQILLESDKNLKNIKETSSNLEQSNNRLELDIIDLNLEIKILKNDLTQKQTIEKENLILNETLKEKLLEIELLQKENSNLNDNLNENQQKYFQNIEESRIQKTCLEENAKLKEYDIKILNDIINSKAEENLSNLNEIKILTTDISKINTEKDNLKETLKNNEIQNSNLMENLYHIESKLKENISINGKLTIENSKLIENGKEKQKTIEEFQQSLEHVRLNLTLKANEFNILEAQYMEKVFDNENLKQNCEDFANKLKEMKEKNQQLIKQNKEVSELNDSFKKQLNDVQIGLKNLKEANCKLQESKSSFQMEILDLNNLLSENRSCIEKIKANNNLLANENNQHVKTIDEINNLLKAAEKTIKDKKDEITYLELKLTAKTNDNLDLEEQCNQLANKLSSIVQKQDVALGKLRNLTSGDNNETDDIENLLKLLGEQKNILTDQVKKKDDENVKYRSDLNELSQEKVNIQNELNNFKKLYEKKCDELGNINNNNNFKIKGILDEIKNKSVENKFHAYEITYENLMQSVNIILNSNSEFINKISIFEKDVTLLSDNVEKECAAKLLLQKEKETLIEEIELLKTQINNLNDKCEKMNKNYLHSDEENMKLVSDITNYESEIKILKQEISCLKENEIKLELLNNTANNNITGLQKEIELNSIELKSKTEECRTLRDNLEKMITNIKELNEEKSKIALELTKSLAEYKSKIDEYNTLNDKFNNMDSYRLQLETDLEKTKKNLMNQANSHTEKILLLEKNLLQTEEQIKSREQNIANLQDELNTISDKNKKMSLDLDITIKKLQKETEIYNNIAEKNKEFGNKIRLLEEHIKRTEEVLQKCNCVSESQRSELEQVQIKFEKIEKENLKLNKQIDQFEENSIQLNKKLEKNAIRLGDYQSKASKFEKESAQLKKQIEETNAKINNLQRIESKLQIDLNTYKDKLKISEAENLQLNNEKRKLEENVDQAKYQLSKVLNSEMEARDKNKEEIGNLKNENKYIEQLNIELTHKIGGLNKTIEDLKKSNSNLKNEHAENVKELEADCNNLKKINQQFLKELEETKEMKTKDVDNLAKTVELLKKLQSDFDNKTVELNNLREMFNEIKIKNDLLENEKLYVLKQLEELKSMEQESKLKGNDIEQEMLKYVTIIDNKDKTIYELNQQIEELKLKESKESEEGNFKFCEMKIKYEEIKQLYENQIAKTDELKKNISIFEAKLYKSRQNAELNEKQWNEEKAKLLSEKKENRIELEGKLEKMKTKMKTLYNEEVAKLKSKHDREIFDYESQLKVLEPKKEKFEEHCKKLSQQIFKLKEQIAIYERDHKFMESKLKDYEQCKTNSMTRSQQNKVFNIAPPTNSISNKFQMEDEEGEIFNNTYLTDLKEGRMSDFGVRDSISVKEMQYRNSLAPPHLRSTYLAQYKDHNLPEEDIKEGIHINLDDSLTSLLSGEKRKKMAGTTSYKKPGPPTPSKTAGRLSFGGNNDVQSSILKESNDDASHKKTPSKFKLFSSRGVKDEKPQISATSKHTGRRASNKFKPVTRHLHLGFQSSTPRKSKIHFHPINALGFYSSQNKDDEPVPSNNCETPQNSNFQLWRQKKIIYNSATTSDSNSPLISDSEKLLKKRNNRRVSIYDHGNIYSRRKPNSKRSQNHLHKAKLERANNFNKYRRNLNEVNLRKSILSQNFHNDNLTIFPSTISSITAHYDDEERFSNIIGNQLTYNMDVTINNNNKSSREFEELIQQIESTAPFEVNTNISDSLNSKTFNIENNQQLKIVSNNINDNETNIELSTNGSLVSGTSTSHSKTLYPSNIIVNRKIPCLNKTKVNIRNSSFYMKNGNVIFGPNTKITIKDLFEIRNRISVDVKIIFLLCSIIIVFLLSYAISWIRS